MPNFNLENYEEVKDRLPKFWEKYPAGSIVTDLISPVTDLKAVVFKATISVSGNIIATGWAMEKEGEGYINKTSHVENCETSAIGRALANAGFSGFKSTERPSREEMQKVKKQTKQEVKDDDI